MLRSDLFCEDFGAAKATGGRVINISRIHGFDVLFGDHSDGERRGRYATLECGNLYTENGSSHSDTVHALSDIFAQLLQEEQKFPPKRILTVGLGNEDVTADSLGGKAVDRITVTNSAGSENIKGLPETYVIKAGTGASGGIDSAELVKSIADLVKAELVICIDALAARSVERLGSVIQVSNAGISPGSGVSRHTSTISRDTLGVPMLSVGIPTVISGRMVLSESSDSETDETLFTVAAVDSLVKLGGAVIAGAVNLFFMAHCRII